jgi:hypothetical protein
MQTGVSSGWSTLSVKCVEWLIINRLAGAERLVGDTVWGTVLSRGPRGLCSLAHVSGALGMKNLVAQFGLTLTPTCLGLGLIHEVMIRSSRCTPSLRTGNV